MIKLDKIILVSIFILTFFTSFVSFPIMIKLIENIGGDNNNINLTLTLIIGGLISTILILSFIYKKLTNEKKENIINKITIEDVRNVKQNKEKNM